MKTNPLARTFERNTRLALVLAAGLMLLLGAVLFARASTAAGAEPSEDLGHDLEFMVEDGGESYVVRVDFLFAGGATEADKAAASEAMAARFAGATPIAHEDGDVSAQFVTSGPAWANHEVSWFYNAANKPGNLIDEAGTLASAANTWNEVGVKWAFHSAGPTTLSTGGCGTTRDSQNTLGWAAQPGNTLAVTCTWSTSGTNQKYVEVDMELDPQQGWTLGSSGVGTDLQSVALHEFGHALGLGHTQTAKCPGSVMCATYVNGTTLRKPVSDDIAGAVSLYGPSTGATATPSPRATPFPTATATPARTTAIKRGPFKALAAGASRN